MVYFLKNKFLLLFARLIISGILFFTATLAQLYWATNKASQNTISSSCIECNYLEDVFFLSIFGAVLLLVLFSVLRFIKNRRYKMVLQSITLIMVWYFCNHIIVTERITSWSTFTFGEEVFLIISLSFFPVLVLFPITILTNFYLDTVYQKFKQKSN